MLIELPLGDRFEFDFDARVERVDPLDEVNVHDTAIIERSGIPIGGVVAGPAIIEEATATTLVPDNWQAEVIAGDHMTLKRKEA